MTEVAVNYNINLTQVIDSNTELDASQAAEVEAVLKAAGDDEIWDSLDTSDDVFQVGGAGKPIIKPCVPRKIIVNPNDPHVIEIGKFAVKKHNEQAGTSLVFVRVIGGLKWKVVLGTFYALMISAKDNKGTHAGKALVFEAITGHKKLIWWKN